MRLKLLCSVLAWFVTTTLNAQATDKYVMAYAKSIEYEKKQNYQEAIRTINELKDSALYENHLRLGWLYYKLGQKKKSMKCYEKAISIMPKAIEPRLGYGYPAYQLEDFEDLIAQDLKILEIDPNHKATLLNLGLIHFYAKEYKKAAPYFTKITEQYPFDYDANLTLAWCYLYLEKKAEAEKYFSTVLLYSPQDASAKEGMDLVKQSTSQNEKLIEAFSKSYEMSSQSNNQGALNALKEVYDKNSYILNLRMGWLAYQLKQHNESSNYYKIAAELNPKAIESKLGWALPVEAMGNKNDLILIYESILQNDPHNTMVSYKLGNVYYQKKDFAKALPYFEKVVTLYPFDYDGLVMRGWTLYYLGKTVESRQFFNKALCTLPNDKSALYGLSLKGIDVENKAPKLTPLGK